MKKVLMILISLVILTSPAFFGDVSANAIPELKAKYSANSPLIDGSLGSAEWNDTVKYVFDMTNIWGNVTIGTWLYIKHNGTHINLGLLVGTPPYYVIDHSVDEFTLIFDEGDDAFHGSGTRDYALTSLQEDLKSWGSDQVLSDGYYNASWYAETNEIDFYANATHENDHAPDMSEIEYWEGEGWVDDHWECEFSIPFAGNDEGTSDVSDLSCTVLDTIGIKLQYFFQPATNFYYPAGGITLVDTFANLSFPAPLIESCNATGDKKDNFTQYESIYVNGNDFLPSTAYDFYIVDDVTTWVDGTPIPARIPSTAATIITDSNGNVSPVEVWSAPSDLGKYDIIVDVNGNGLYEEGIDALDDNDVDLTAGFMIPEYALFSALLLFQAIALLALIAYKRKHPI